MYARDCKGLWVSAKLTKKRKYQAFFCDCPTQHRMKLVKPSGLVGKRLFGDYFAHIQSGHKKSKINSVRTECYSGGESMIHRMAKHKLREFVGSYYFPVFCCCDCSSELDMDTTGCSVSIEVVSADKLWRYDCLLKQGTLAVAALEVVHTHLTGLVKTQSVISSGLSIAEFRAEDVMAMTGDCRTRLDNLKMRVGRCESCLIQLSLSWIRHCWECEMIELVASQHAEFENYVQMDNERREREALLKLWGNVCQIGSPLKRCHEFIRLNIHKICIDSPLLGCLRFSKSSSSEYGVLVSGFSSIFPTSHMFIFLVDDESVVNRRQWKHPQVETSFHLFLHCKTVLRYLSSPCEEMVILKDCRWAILKALEKQTSTCANCGKQGHASETCLTNFCVRCGRRGHTSGQCFARLM